MTPQEVIKSFMAKLVEDANLSGTNKLDSAVAAVSKYSSISDAIAAMKADQIAAEEEAVEEVLGSNYAGKTISQVDSSVLNTSANQHDGAKAVGNAFIGGHSPSNNTTVESVIKERKAYIFLEKYCGIQLAKRYWFMSSDSLTMWGESMKDSLGNPIGLTGNVDTGAITGSDANITLKAGDEVNGTILTTAIMQKLAQKDGVSLSGDTLIVGTGTEKTDRSIVPEIGNKYTAKTSQAQNIKTGSNDWIVVATSGNDTITTGGADSINAGAGADKITVGADYASIQTGAGNDTVEISAEVKNVTLQDLNSSDTLKISGTFEAKTAKIEDTMLVVTDKTGTRQIRLGNLDNAKSAKINSTTIANWLTNAGIDLNNLPTSSSNTVSDSVETEIGVASGEVAESGDGEGQIPIDPDYKATPIQKTTVEDTQDLPTRSASTTGNINVNLDNVSLASGDLEIDGSKVGEISSEFPNITSYTKNGLTINLVGVTSDTDGGTGNIESKTFDQLTEDQKTIVAGLFKWWAKECLQLNEESYGISFNSPTAQVKEIGLFFYDGNGKSNTLATVWNWSTSGTKQNTTKLMLNVNMDYYAGIKEDNFDGESSKSSAGLLDRTLAHEFTHAVMATNLHYFNTLPKFIKEGMAELTHGIDDFRPTNIFKIAYDADWLNASLDLSNTGTGSQSVGDGYSGGYMFLRYLAKQAALQSLFDGVTIPGDDNPLLITLTENSDTYTNTLASATVLALAGNDSIYNYKADNFFIDGGAGNDSILNGGSNDGGDHGTILGGDGDDYIVNYGGDSVIMDGGSGNDAINNMGKNVTIQGNDGNDYIGNSGASSTINGGSGNDVIDNISANVIIMGDKGDDDIVNTFGASYGVETSGAHSTIDGGAGNDSIRNWDSDLVSINGGAGNDSIQNSGKNVTIDGGDGNDSIHNSGFYDNVDETKNSGKNSTINGDAGNDYIENAGGDDVTINGGVGDDEIANYGSNASIVGGDGKDSIFNHSVIHNDRVIGNVTISGNNSTIDGGKGNDYIDNWNKLVSINGGAGNDVFANDGEGSTILGGDDNDSIQNWGANSKLEGGTGNDTISNYADNVLFNYTAGDGNDIIQGFNETSTLSIAGSSYSSVKSGNNLILTVGTGKITLANAATLSTVNIKGTLATDTTPSSEVLTLTNASNAAVTLGSNIKYADASARTKAIRIIGNAKDNSIVGGTANDTLEGLSGNDTLTGGKGADIFVYNGGNDIITDYEVKDKISLASDLTYKNYAIRGNDLILGYGTNNSLTIADGKDKTITSVVGKTTNVNIYTTEGIFDAKKTIVTLASSASDFDAVNYSALVTIDGAATRAIKITGNAKANRIIAGNSGSTLNGGKGNDTLTGGKGADTFVYENKSGNKTIDNYGAGDKISLDSNATLTDASVDKKGNAVLKVSGNTLTVNNSSNVTLTTGGKDTIYTGGVFTDPTKATATLPATFAKEFNLGNYKNADSSSRTGAIKITGNAQANSILGSKGNDTLDGLGGNDTLQGGLGNDLFVFTGGKDVITDYDPSKDKISVSSNLNYSNFAISGTDLILGYGSNNSLTVKDGKDKAININSVTKVYSDGTIFDSKKTSVTLASTSGNFDSAGYSALVTIDGTATRAIKITGNAKANKIYAGTNGSILNGGTGNDTLTGGNGADTFIYENKSGNKVIDNYSTGDKISLGADATLTDASVDKKGNAVLKVSGNTLTVNNSSNVTLTAGGKDIIYTGGVFTDSTKATATLPATFAKEFNLGNYKNADSSSRSGAIKITGNAQANSILGSKGNDTLDGLGGNDTLQGGLGNDLFVFTGGKDVITDYDPAKDKISVASNLTYSNFAINGTDLILGYGTNNSLTVKDGKDKSINVNSVVKIYSNNVTFDSKQTSATLKATSGNFDAAGYPALVTIDGAATGAIKITGNAKANNIIAGNNGSTLNGGTGNDTLTGGNGADTFVYENKSGNKTIDNYGTGDKISLGADATLTDASVDKKGNTILKVGSNSITIKSSNDISILSDGGEMIYSGGVFTNTAKTNATLPATFAKEFNMGTFKNADSSSRSGAVKIIGNSQNNSIFGGSGADTLDGAAGNDTLTGGKGNDIFVYSSGNDFITDYDTKDKISIDGELVYTNYAISGDNVVLNYSGSKSLTIKDGKDKAITSFTGKKTNVNVYSTVGIFDTNKTTATLASSTTSFDAAGYSALVTIDGSAATGKIKIVGNAKANRIIAGANGSTLNGGTGNDTLTGGNGADIFIYENKSGNKVINNYAANDKISLGSDATITDAWTKNNASTIKIGSNSVTINSSDDITFASDGVETIYSGGVFTTKNTAKVYSSYTGTINLKSNVTTADATLASKAVTVQGGTANDSILGGSSADKLYGNGGKDTLNGGKGNDTLWGGAGNDNFIYKANEGNDVIADYATGDLVTILDKKGDAGTFSKATFNNNALTMNIIGGGSLTLKDVNASTTFNINGDNYRVSNKTIAK